MKSYSKRRGVHVTDADVEMLRSKGFTLRDSWKKPLPVPTADAKQNARYGSGFRYDLGIYVRSSWEANAGRIFSLQQREAEIIKWEYEPQEFTFPVKRGRGKFYKPDFRIWPTADTYHWIEIKGQMDEVSVTKLKRMQKHYPEEQVILIREREYRQWERLYGPRIPEWEYD